MPDKETWRSAAFNTIECTTGVKIDCNFVETEGGPPLSPSPPQLDGFLLDTRGSVKQIGKVIDYHHYTRVECKLFKPKDDAIYLTCKSY